MPLGATRIGAVVEWAGALWGGVLVEVGHVAVTLAAVAVGRRIWNL